MIVKFTRTFQSLLRGVLNNVCHILFDQQWCMLHYPKRPNGFAVLILGDQQHYVHENSSVWIENTGRAK